MPAPEPGPLTAILTSELAFMKFSAHTELSGVMVLEPMILNEPDNAGVVFVGVVVGVEVGVAVVPQPVTSRAAASASARGKNHFLTDFNNFFSFY